MHDSKTELVGYCRALLLLSIACCLALPVAAQAVPEGSISPEQTNLGTFDGTWFYVNRDIRVGLWMRTGDDGKPELKIQLLRLRSAELVETDWQGPTDYFMRDVPGRFELAVQERDANRIEGTWSWVLGVDRPSSRTETAELSIYRTLDGRQLVMDFHGWERVIRRGGVEVKRSSAEQVWVFLKASKRLVLWDELPF